MPEQRAMSPGTKELLTKLRMIVPPMLEKFHKGTSYNLFLFGFILIAEQVNWAE